MQPIHTSRPSGRDRMPSTRIVILVIAGAIVAAIAAASAQSPDFSGTWVAEAPPSPPPPAGTPPPPPRGNMGSGWGSTITITHAANQLVIEQPVFSRYDLQPPLKFVYTLDGSESRNTVMAGHETQTRVSRAAWAGQTARIVTIYPGIDPDSGKPFSTEVTQQLSLAEPGQLIIETLRRGALGGRDITTRTVYVRAP